MYMNVKFESTYLPRHSGFVPVGIRISPCLSSLISLLQSVFCHTASLQHTCQDQWFFCRRNISKVTPKSVYFHYVTNCFLDQSMQTIFHSILKTETLATTHVLHTSVVSLCSMGWVDDAQCFFFSRNIR